MCSLPGYDFAKCSLLPLVHQQNIFLLGKCTETNLPKQIICTMYRCRGRGTRAEAEMMLCTRFWVDESGFCCPGFQCFLFAFRFDCHSSWHLKNWWLRHDDVIHVAMSCELSSLHWTARVEKQKNEMKKKHSFLEQFFPVFHLFAALCFIVCLLLSHTHDPM